MNKLLLIIFSVLAIVAVGELTYIFVLHSGLPSLTPTTQSSVIVVTPTPLPNHMVNLDTLQTLTHWQKGVVYSAKVTAEYRGIIEEVDTKGGQIKEGSVPFNFALKITIIGDKRETNDIYLNSNELSKTTFKQTVQGITKQINYTDLKAGDKIQAFVTQDLTKNFDNNFVSAEIIKL